MKKNNTIWVEEFRPQTLEDYVGNEGIKSFISRHIEENDIPHLLLHGRAGTGKTTLAKIITKNMDCDSMYINASDERGIDTIRDKVVGFASTNTFRQLKVIILDECLDENTLVTVLRNGNIFHIPIKDLNDSNDLVKSFNIEKNRIEWKPFILYDKGMRNVYEIEFENDEIIICTPEHKWFVKDEKEDIKVVKTTELENYGAIFNPESSHLYIDEKGMHLDHDNTLKIRTIKKIPQEHHVYDLSVPGNHNFFIGKEEEILTHNCDMMTYSSQPALRSIMETYSDKTRFILTANNVDKIIEPLRSRCQIFHIEPPSRADVARRVASILEAKNISFELPVLATIVKTYYPDIRRTINAAQQSIDENNKLSPLVLEQELEGTLTKIINIIQSKDKNSWNSIRQVVADNEISDFSSLYTGLYERVNEYSASPADISIHLAQYLWQNNTIVDKELNFMALISRILETNIK